MPYFNYQSHRIFYREQGTGELLLILPGNTASSVWHEGELAYFSDRYHVVALDVLGTGQSDRINRWSTDWWLESAQQGKALCDHLNASRCVVMGCSGGAVAALLMANAGSHPFMWTQPEVFRTAADQFLGTLPTTR